MKMPPFSPRQAKPADEALAFGIFEASMKHDVDLTWGWWDPEHQRRGHRQHFNPASHWIVASAGQTAGLICLENHATHL